MVITASSIACGCIHKTTTAELPKILLSIYLSVCLSIYLFTLIHSTKLQGDFAATINFDAIYSNKLRQNLSILKRKVVEKEKTKSADAA